LDLRIEPRDGLTVAWLSGELIATDSTELTDSLVDYACGETARLVVDLSGVRVLDSSGLGVLIHVVTRARMTGGRVALAAPTSFVRGVLAVTRLDNWFDVYDTLADAETNLRKA
jgi:anti-sigma B factor antagonist